MVELNPQFINYLTDRVVPELRQAISHEFGLPLKDIPDLAIADLPEVAPQPRTLFRKLRPSASGICELVTVTPAELTDRATFYITTLGSEGLSHLATAHRTSLEQIQARLVKGAAFEVVTEALLGLVNANFTEDDKVNIIDAAAANL